MVAFYRATCVVQRRCHFRIFTPSRRLFISWQLIIDWAKAREKARAIDIRLRPKWLTSGRGDVKCVDLGQRMDVSRLGTECEAGTISLIALVNEDMGIEKPNPRTAKSRGKATDIKDEILSIVSTFTIDGNLCQKEVCAALLPYLTGWERIFVSEVARIENIGAIRKAKLRAIVEEVLENPPRLCRYCNSKVTHIDEYSYACPKCGNCFNLNWIGGDR